MQAIKITTLIPFLHTIRTGPDYGAPTITQNISILIILPVTIFTPPLSRKIMGIIVLAYDNIALCYCNSAVFMRGIILENISNKEELPNDAGYVLRLLDDYQILIGIP
jgi:hypothetical protein